MTATIAAVPRSLRGACSCCGIVSARQRRRHGAADVPGKARYRDAGAPLEARVEDLLGRMTLEEKIAQITTIWDQKKDLLDAQGEFDAAKRRQRYPAGIGPLRAPERSHRLRRQPDHDALPRYEANGNLINAMQRDAVRNTRLGIPVLFHEEALHGYAARGATHFPQAIALASSWDPELLTRVFTVAAREVRARGVHLVLAPVVDVGRDPRWGRIEETYGEDPYLVGELGVAAVRGFQGDTLPLAPGQGVRDAEAHDGSRPAGSRHERRAREHLRARAARVLLPALRSRRSSARNVMSVMPSYNEIDGVPSHANTWLLTRSPAPGDGLQGRGRQRLLGHRRSCRSCITSSRISLSAAVRALKAGVDFDLPDGNAYEKLPEALAAGRVTQAQIDAAVRRMLRMKFLVRPVREALRRC